MQVARGVCRYLTLADSNNLELPVRANRDSTRTGVHVLSRMSSGLLYVACLSAGFSSQPYVDDQCHVFDWPVENVPAKDKSAEVRWTLRLEPVRPIVV